MEDYEIKENNFYEDYSIVDESLGNGVTGDVRVCTDKDMNRFAVKVLPDCKEYRNEVYIQWLCGANEHVVEVLAVYSNYLEDDETGTLFVVMELMDKGDLWTTIYHTKMTEGDIKHTLYQIICGLKHLHTHEISHRDLKPENIMIKSTGFNSYKVKLGDFGYAEEKSQKMTEALYTFYYAAPEVLKNDPKFNKSVLVDGPTPYDKRCDLYSLGVITYVMLMGYPPFLLYGARKMTSDLYESITNGYVFNYRSDWEEYPPEAKDFVFSLLNVDPDKRPSAKELLSHPWLCPKGYW